MLRSDFMKSESRGINKGKMNLLGLDLDDPKNDQYDQSMTHFSGKLSGHDDPKNDQNDYSLWVIIGS